MNWVDGVITLIFLLTIWAGYRRGFIHGSLNLLSWAASIVSAYFMYGYTKNFLEGLANFGIWLLPVSFLVTLVLTSLLFNLLTNHFTASNSKS